METVTQWFDGKPVRKGVYQTQNDGGDEWFNYFDGRRFHWGFRGENAIKNSARRITRPNPLPIHIHKRWRGLAEKPKSA